MLQNADPVELRAARNLRLAMVAAVALVFGLAYLDLAREQRRALDDFAAEQISLARALAGTLEARLQAVVARLSAAAALADDPQAGPALRDLIRATSVDRELDVLDVEGRPIFEVSVTPGPRLGDSPSLLAARAQAVREVGPDRPWVSGPLWRGDVPDDRERLRLFAQRAGPRTVVLLVDTARLFGDVVRPSTVPMRWLALDDTGRRIDLAPPPINDAQPGVRRLLARMGEGAEGAVTLERPAAEALGLERRRAVAGIAPVRTPLARAWSVAAVASAMRVRDRARVGAWRLGAATGLAGLLVALFGLVISRQLERARTLAEALRLAQATAALRARAERSEKLATIGTLAAGIAHEVGTPLGIISGRAEQLLQRLPGHADPSDRKALSSIIAQVDKVSATIRQLLDFARVRPVEAAPVRPAPIVDAAAALLAHRFKQAKVALAVEAPPSLPPVLGDAGQLEQVLVNLLINAGDACAAGGQVRLTASLNERQVWLEVEDDGCGIAEGDLPQVLDPFFTTKKRGQGTGLGLSIVADIVRNHGGELAIDSAVGRGTRVRVKLPVAEAAA